MCVIARQRLTWLVWQALQPGSRAAQLPCVCTHVCVYYSTSSSGMRVVWAETAAVLLGGCCRAAGFLPAAHDGTARCLWLQQLFLGFGTTHSLRLLLCLHHPVHSIGVSSLVHSCTGVGWLVHMHAPARCVGCTHAGRAACDLMSSAVLSSRVRRVRQAVGLEVPGSMSC